MIGGLELYCSEQINPSLIRAAACCGEITQISAHGAEASFSITNFPCGYRMCACMFVLEIILQLLAYYSMIEGSPTTISQ
jgi:hypothetical protein